MNSISLTIPLDHSALTRASEMLHGMALDLLNENNIVSNKGSKFTDTEIFEKFHSEDKPPPVIEAVNRALTETATEIPAPKTETIVGGVELDADGLPHDLRIHGAKRLKTAKEQTWKKIRGVDPALVATVEAELRQAMATSPDKPIEPVATQEALTLALAPAPTPPAPVPVSETIPVPEPLQPEPTLYLVNGNQFTADQLRTAGWNDEQITACEVVSTDIPAAITFPEFMAKLNPALKAGTVTQPIVDAALNKAGLASLPLLSARPDLIPGVMAELF